MKKKGLLFLLLLLLVAGAYFGYRYLYKEHRDIQSEAAAMTLSANALKELFVNSSTPQVLNQTVLVSGNVTELDAQSVTLDGVVNCVLLDSPSTLTLGEHISIKGRCIGYDDLFELVKLDQSKLIVLK